MWRLSDIEMHKEEWLQMMRDCLDRMPCSKCESKSKHKKGGAVMRLIDADDIYAICDEMIEEAWNHKTAPGSWAVAYEEFKDEIERVPTIDAEPVVHCKDCACVRAVHLGNKFVYRCPVSTVDVEPEGYCSRGVRRNEDLGTS